MPSFSTSISFAFSFNSSTQRHWIKTEPRHIHLHLQVHPLSTKVLFVRFDPPDQKLPADNHKSKDSHINQQMQLYSLLGRQGNFYSVCDQTIQDYRVSRQKDSSSTLATTVNIVTIIVQQKTLIAIEVVPHQLSIKQTTIPEWKLFYPNLFNRPQQKCT